MSLPRKGNRNLPKVNQTPPRTPSVDHTHTPHPDLDSQALMQFNGVTYNVSADDLEILNSLGRGQYGQVDRVRHKGSGFEFAVKRIRSTDDPVERKTMLMDLQVNSVNGGRCPYVVRSFGALFREGDLWICMEVMDISLEMFYKKIFALNIDFPEEVISHIAFAIVSGLQFLKEELNIMHRDVKPSNVLLSRKGEIKLCDFGISGKLVQSMAKTNVGCSLYMPPERVDPTAADDQGFDIRSDVWSVGVTMIEVATGKHPFTIWKNPFEQMNKVVNGPPPKLPDNSHFSDDFKSFVTCCCHKEYLQRPKYTELLHHPFIARHEGQVSDIHEFVNQVLDAKN